MAASTTTALSFENSPIAVASASPASQRVTPARKQPAVDVAKQTRKHAEAGQQIGAAHDVGDGFGENRMQGPDRGQRKGQALFQLALLEQQQTQQVDQRDVDGVQREIDQ